MTDPGMKGPTIEEAIELSLGDVRYPTPVGYAEKFQKWNVWTEPQTRQTWVRFKVRIAGPIDGLDSVLYVNPRSPLISAINAEEGTETIKTYAYESRGLIGRLDQIEELKRHVRSGDVPVCVEGMRACYLDELDEASL